MCHYQRVNDLLSTLTRRSHHVVLRGVSFWPQCEHVVAFRRFPYWQFGHAGLRVANINQATTPTTAPKHTNRPRIDFKSSMLAPHMLSLSLSGPLRFSLFARGLVSFPTRFRSLKDRIHHARCVDHHGNEIPMFFSCPVQRLLKLVEAITADNPMPLSTPVNRFVHAIVPSVTK